MKTKFTKDLSAEKVQSLPPPRVRPNRETVGRRSLETAEELLHRVSAATKKRLILRITFQLYDPTDKHYHGLQGFGMSLDCANAAVVLAVRRRLGRLLELWREVAKG